MVAVKMERRRRRVHPYECVTVMVKERIRWSQRRLRYVYVCRKGMKDCCHVWPVYVEWRWDERGGDDGERKEEAEERGE